MIIDLRNLFLLHILDKQILLSLLKMLGTVFVWSNNWSDSINKYTVNFPIVFWET